jgi:hypothetical protein
MGTVRKLQPAPVSISKVAHGLVAQHDGNAFSKQPLPPGHWYSARGDGNGAIHVAREGAIAWKSDFSSGAIHRKRFLENVRQWNQQVSPVPVQDGGEVTARVIERYMKAKYDANHDGKLDVREARHVHKALGFSSENEPGVLKLMSLKDIASYAPPRGPSDRR